CCFLLLRVLRCFPSPRVPRTALWVQAAATVHDDGRVSPFGDPRTTAWSAAPRGLAQPPTYLFVSWRQGIHTAPLVAYHAHASSRCPRRFLCSSQGTAARPPGAVAGAGSDRRHVGRARAAAHPQSPTARLVDVDQAGSEPGEWCVRKCFLMDARAGAMGSI